MKIIDSAILITVTTALMFAFGIAEYNGYLNELGIVTDFISFDTHQLLYTAFLSMFSQTFIFLMRLFLVGTILVGICFLYTLLREELSTVREWALKRFKPEKPATTEKVVEVAYYGFLKLGVVILVFYLVFRGLVYAEGLGKEHGQKDRQKLIDHTYEKHEVVKLDVPRYKGEIYVVACGSNNCSGVDVKTLEVVYFENRFGAGDAVGVVKR